MNRLQFTLEAFRRRAAARLWPPYGRARRALREHLQRLFEQQRIDVVFDVGANRGQYYRFLRYEVGFRGVIASFEPIAGLSARLVRQARHDRRWLVASHALGAVDRVADLNVMKASAFSSLLTPDVTATDQFAGRNVIDHVERVDIRRLDGIYPELAERFGFTRAYLKMDTQGHDLAVLEGASGCLANVFALQSELSFVSIYSGMPSWDESVGRIGAAGFDLTGLIPVSTADDMRLIEADGVFVRRAAERPRDTHATVLNARGDS